MLGSLDTAINVGLSIKAANITSATATDGASVNCGTASWARLFVDVPTLTGNETVAAIVESSPTGTGDWTAVTGASITPASAGVADNRVAHGLISLRKTTGQHLRVVLTTGGTVNVLVTAGFVYGPAIDREAARQTMDFRILEP